MHLSVKLKLEFLKPLYRLPLFSSVNTSLKTSSAVLTWVFITLSTSLIALKTLLNVFQNNVPKLFRVIGNQSGPKIISEFRRLQDV